VRFNEDTVHIGAMSLKYKVNWRRARNAAMVHRSSSRNGRKIDAPEEAGPGVCCSKPPQGRHPPITVPEPLSGKQGHPPTLGVHPITHVVRAIKPKRAAGVPVNAGIVARVTMLAWMPALPFQPFVFGFGDVGQCAHGA